MNHSQSCSLGFKQRLADWATACYCLFGAVWVFAEQTAKLWRIEAAGAQMADSPAGRFEWGFVWSDTLVFGPFLLLGGLFLIARRTRRQGHLFAFSGFAINLYATIFLWVGYWAGGQPLGLQQVLILLPTSLLAAVCMVYSAAVLLGRDRQDVRPANATPPER
jgi:hypothetical protein